MDLPLKFALRAQLPSGEIVPVKLVYSNIHRYCRHCRRISHELESCPLLTEAERKEKSLNLEEDRDPAYSNKFEAQKTGDTSKRSQPQASKDRRSGEDSVWKRIDSRYDPRVDPRPKTRFDHRYEKTHSDRQRDPPNRDSYNKRRYDESFLISKQREASRRDKEKERDRNASPNRKEARDLSTETVCSPKIVAAAVPQIAEPNPSADPARQNTVSPEHTRERPFRLNLQSRASTDLKLKGKISEIDEASDEVSSARKSLTFEAPSDTPSVNLPPAPTLVLPKDNTKSWYEMTLEEEETMVEDAAIPQVPSMIPNNLERVGLPLNERILEEEDWLEDGNDFGDADGNDFGEEDIDLME
ncbi:hypothetical protein DY000_02020587 [Brassica cretica]|uniref:Zinc knuckle CX2CX4HX4C domain-containing protein n=1 Tax=Brassica cretica TaxID=69181 RepID=A0ABQ7EA17_BRACR|nr:hypothetical protein DY000_02020587 [Brassica cretica]